MYVVGSSVYGGPGQQRVLYSLYPLHQLYRVRIIKLPQFLEFVQRSRKTLENKVELFACEKFNSHTRHTSTTTHVIRFYCKFHFVFPVVKVAKITRMK